MNMLNKGFKFKKFITSLTCAFLLVFFGLQSAAQTDDFGWWNQLHQWKPGMPGWKRWLIISPGYLGPNALPVPEVKKGYIPTESEIAFSASRHFHPGDPTQDLAGRLYLPFAEGKIAFEAYGALVENYSYSEEIRDMRFSRDFDGKGVTQGDIYFGTLIQISRGRVFPNTLFRFVSRTASGGAYHAARFSDNPGYFFDFSFSKEIEINRTALFRPFASFGFYSWQTNSEENLQNDAPLYGAGIEFQNMGWLITGSFSGYSGYMLNKDKPQVATLNVRHDWKYSAAAIDFIAGLRDWEYQTIRFTYTYKFKGL